MIAAIAFILLVAAAVVVAAITFGAIGALVALAVIAAAAFIGLAVSQGTGKSDPLAGALLGAGLTAAIVVIVLVARAVSPESVPVGSPTAEPSFALTPRTAPTDAAPPASTERPAPTGRTGPSPPLLPGATADVVIDGTSYARSGGTCRAGQDDETHYWALSFIGPGDDYLSVLMSADAPIGDGSYTGADVISTLIIEGVADYNVRVDVLNLRDNLSHGDFSGSADVGRISISGTFDCSGPA